MQEKELKSNSLSLKAERAEAIKLGEFKCVLVFQGWTELITCIQMSGTSSAFYLSSENNGDVTVG